MMDLTSQDLNESLQFQKTVKSKQGNLFNQEPDYLKGKGLLGEVDNDVNALASIHSSNLFTNSQIQYAGKEFTIVLNGDDVNFIQSFSKQYSNQGSMSGDFSILSKSQDVSKEICKETPNLIPPEMSSTLMQINQQEGTSEQNKNKPLLCKSVVQNLLRTTSNLSSEHPQSPDHQQLNQFRKERLKSRYGDNFSNYVNQSMLSSGNVKRELSSNHVSNFQKQGAQNKLVDKLINAELAKNIICKVFQQSHNRKERVKLLIEQFVNRLKSLSSKRKPCGLSESDYKIINDLTYFKELKASKKVFSQLSLFANKYKLLIQSFPVILPTNVLIILWDIFQILFTYFFCYIYSILLFFDFDNEEGYLLNVIFQISLVLFLADTLVNFNIAYYQQDKIITQRNQIAKRYIFSFFTADFTCIAVLLVKIFANISLQYNPTNDALLYFRNSLVFLKLAGIQRKFKRIEETIIVNDYIRLILKIVSLIFFTITVAHLVGISWHALAVIENIYNVPNTWMQKLNIESAPFYTRYIYSVYWSMTTMTTIGYGDITPQNQYECLFTTVNMIFLSCIFAYSINNIGMILHDLEKKSRILRYEISTFQRFLDRKKVSIELKSRVTHYLKFLANESKDRNKDKEQQVFEKLSNELRNQVTTQINSQIINKYHLFTTLFTQKLREQMTYIMEEVLISPNEIIFLDNQIDDSAVYFIQGGCIEIFHNNVHKQQQSHQRIKLLHQNDLFGELSFFSGQARKASARSLNLSTLYKIKRLDFINLIQKYHEDFERFKMIQDRILNLNDLMCIEIKCYNCSQKGHLSLECPNIHQIFDKQFFILKTNYSVNQERRPYERKFKAFLPPMDLIQRNKGYLLQLRENLEKFNSSLQIMLLEDEEEQRDKNNMTYQTVSSNDNKSFEGQEIIREGSQILLNQSFKVDNPMLSDKEKERGNSDYSNFSEKQNKNFFHNKKFKTNQSVQIQQIQEENEEGLNTQIFGDAPIANPLDTDSNLQHTNTNANQENLPTSMNFSQNREVNHFYTNQFGRKQTIQSKKEIKTQGVDSQNNSCNVNSSDHPNLNSSISDQTPQLPQREEIISLYTLQDNKDNKTTNGYQASQITSLNQIGGQPKYFQQVSSKLFNYDSQNTINKPQTNYGQNFILQTSSNDQHTLKCEGSPPNQKQSKRDRINSLNSEQQNFADFLKKYLNANQKDTVNESFQQNEVDINSLDKIKLYKFYFPHNNFDKIMHEHKIKKQELQVMDKVQKKIKGKIVQNQGVYNPSPFVPIINYDPSLPTTISYGIGIKSTKMYALKYQQ